MITLHIFVNTKYYISQYFKCVQLNQRGKPALGETQRVHFRKNAWHYSASRGQQFQKWNMTVIQGLVLLLPPKCICLYTLLQPLEQPTAEFSNRPYPVAMFVKSYLHLCSHSSQTELLIYITH